MVATSVEEYCGGYDSRKYTQKRSAMGMTACNVGYREICAGFVGYNIG